MDAILDRVISLETFLVRLRSGIQNAQLKLQQTYETSIANAIEFLVSDILEPFDEQNHSKIFQEAKKKEIDGLSKR